MTDEYLETTITPEPTPEEKKPINWKQIIIGITFVLVFIGVMMWLDERATGDYLYSECYEEEVRLEKQYLDRTGVSCDNCLILEVESTDPLKTKKTHIFEKNKEIKQAWRTNDILLINWCNYKESGKFVINGIMVKE